MKLIALTQTKNGSYLARFLDDSGKIFCRFVSKALVLSNEWALISPKNPELDYKPTYKLEEYIKESSEVVDRIIYIIEWCVSKTGNEYIKTWDFIQGAFRNYRKDRIKTMDYIGGNQ